MRQKPVVMMVLDGYGITEKEEGNAIKMASTPVIAARNINRNEYLFLKKLPAIKTPIMKDKM